MSTTPWSAHEEKWQRRVVWFDWYMCLVLVTAMVFSVLFKLWWIGAVAGSGAVFFATDGRIQRAKYRAMMQNKPRSTAGLTQWIQLRPWQTEIYCACGRTVRMSVGNGLGITDCAQWYPNPADPGGGRFSIVCPCGIGYFKLRDSSRPAVGGS